MGVSKTETHFRSTIVLFLLAARIAASLQIFAISAPVKPGVSAARRAE